MGAKMLQNWSQLVLDSVIGQLVLLLYEPVRTPPFLVFAHFNFHLWGLSLQDN